MVRAIAPGSVPTRLRRLGGGLGASTHAVALRARNGRTTTVVVKRYEADNGYVTREWAGLKIGARLDVPTPEPLAFDRGSWFGGPTIVMSRAPGRPDVAPANVDRWLTRIAEAMATLHATPTGRLPAIVRAPVGEQAWRSLEGWAPHPRVPDTRTAARAVAFVRRRLRRLRPGPLVLNHGDFHPGNLLWARGRLTSLLDWSSVHLAPPQFDVAYCRTDLAVLLGGSAPDRFLTAYRAAGGRAGEDLAVWDVMQALSALIWGRYWVGAYREQGAVLTRRQVAPRVYAFIERAIASG